MLKCRTEGKKEIFRDEFSCSCQVCEKGKLRVKGKGKVAKGAPVPGGGW